MQTHKFIVGNWKENPEKLETAQQLLQITENFSKKNEAFAIGHAIPSIFAGFLKASNPKSELFLQNISCFEGGSHTGEISAIEAKNLGFQMSIAGHSETRLSPENPKGDENMQVNTKIKNLLAQNMWVLLCIGEWEREDSDYKKFVLDQIESCLEGITDLSKITFAYEPVWAIGKNAKRVATNEEIIEMMEAIKNFLKEKYSMQQPTVLYGGSVDENNAKEIVNLPLVDGLLIGRASSDPVKWEKLLNNLVKVDAKLRGMNELNVKEGTKVVLRLDLNLPMTDAGEIANTHRIESSMAVIDFLQKAGAKTTIIAHLEEGSLQKVAEVMSTMVKNFRFIPKIAAETSPEEINVQNGEFVLLENVRNDKREKEKDEAKRDELGKIYASYGEVYINEAFSASHRNHASITSVPKFLPSALGPNFKEEIEKLNLALNPQHPTFFLVGGAKFDTKLPLIEKFLNIADKIFVGGALAHSFFKAKGYNLGTSLLDTEVTLSDKVLTSKKIMLPVDVMIEDKSTKSPSEITDADKIVDFGPKTLENILEVAKSSNTIVWNGPVDFYEKGYDFGTKELIENFSKMTDKKIILGGGDTVTEIDKVKETDPNITFTHVSTGGGAMIDYLSNGTLPGIEAIQK
jgi:phosphoglycerate kinase